MEYWISYKKISTFSKKFIISIFFNWNSAVPSKAEDKEHCEEYGRLLNADPNKVSTKAKKRGLPQLGTLGAGNHYAEIQVVDEIFDQDWLVKIMKLFLRSMIFGHDSAKFIKTERHCRSRLLSVKRPKLQSSSKVSMSLIKFHLRNFTLKQ